MTEIQSKAQKRAWNNPVRREKHIANLKKMWSSSEFIERQRKAQSKAWKDNPHRRELMREKIRNKWKDESYREKVVKADRESIIRKYREEPEYLEKMFRRWDNPVYREKHRIAVSKAIKKKWSDDAQYRDKVHKALKNPKVREKRSKSAKDMWKRDEYQKRFHIARKRLSENPQYIEKMRKIMGDRWKNDPELREKMSRIFKDKWKNDPEHAKKVFRGLHKKPNVGEVKLMSFLDENYTNVWGYNGDFRLKTVIGGKIPDFINVNGKKQVIELFGEYWHSPLYNSRIPERKTYDATIKHYKKYGFDCLIIWVKELENMHNIKYKIDNFQNDKHYE